MTATSRTVLSFNKMRNKLDLYLEITAIGGQEKKCEVCAKEPLGQGVLPDSDSDDEYRIVMMKANIHMAQDIHDIQGKELCSNSQHYISKFRIDCTFFSS